MSPVLYMTPLSPPSRAVLITAKAINLELELKNVDLRTGQHHAPEFTKINPLHAVPVLVDDGVTITDSHVINAYLVQKYAKQDSPLYPKDLLSRLVVDQKLFFDTGIMFNHFRTIAAPIFYLKSKTVPEEQVKRVLEAYGFVETFLDESAWIAGKDVTIADFSLFTTVTALDVFVPVNREQFPRVNSWLERVRALDYARVSEAGLEQLRNVVEICMKSTLNQ